MKILQVTAGLEQGGVERGTVEMAAYTISQGAESLVASQGGRMVDELMRIGARHITLPLARRNPFAILYCAWRLKKILQSETIDLVHARSRAPAWAAFLACRWTGTPFLTTFHGTHKIQNRLKKWYNSSMVRGQRVIAISEFIRDHIIQNYQIDSSVIDIAPRGFDPQRFDPGEFSPEQNLSLRKELGCSADETLIALPGRLTRWKGQTVFIDALGRIKDLQWKALLIGGPGKKLGYLDELKRRAADNGIADRVLFCGNQHTIAPYYAIADLVVSASIEPEAFGRVAVEGQAMAKPVIASAHGGALETVRDGETGWLFASGDPGDLADHLRYALSGSVDLVGMGQKAREWVLANFTTDRMCQAEWAGYLKILGQ